MMGLAALLFSCPQYFYIYWVLNSTILMLVGFAVMYEVCWLTHFKPYSALIDLGKMLFLWAAVFLFMAGASHCIGNDWHTFQQDLVAARTAVTELFV